MREPLIILLVVALAVICGAPLHADEPTDPIMAGDYPIKPVPPTGVHVDDDFWSHRLQTNHERTIPYAFEKCEETGRIHNFAAAAGLEEGGFEGTFFNDSDVFKVIEGAAYALAGADIPELEAYTDNLISIIAGAQEDDGYLYTARTLQDENYRPPGGTERWSNTASGHELYNVGHMYEAAVAYYEATGKRSLLDVAIKNANLICSVFGPEGRHDPPGHQEIEIGLSRLYRATGEQKYLDMAKFFLDRRGRLEGRERLYGTYSQDHIPVIEQSEAVGHSVRAAYMYTGMADVAVLTGESDYIAAIDRLWEDVVTKKTYITGGIGAAGGHEGFGGPYELPNRSAYCETCASIANAMWNYRMFQLHADAKYIDVVERIIYNGFLSGISMEGDTFFYPNPLESGGGRRSAWFGCACCPSNIVRFVPSIPGYAYAHRDDVLFVNLYIAGTADIPMETGDVQITQEHDYPWDGAMRITVEPEEEGEFEIKLRVPGWASGDPLPSNLYEFLDASPESLDLKINGEIATDVPVENGYVSLRQTWKAGDVIEFTLPMPVRRVTAHEEIVTNRGKVALQRGPIVFCVEGVDQIDEHAFNIYLPDDSEIEATFEPDLLGGVVVLKTTAVSVSRNADVIPIKGDERPLTFIPYYAWAHRDSCEMAVWVARTIESSRPSPGPTIAFRSRASASHGGSLDALRDQLEANSSGDHSFIFFHWWPNMGGQEWAQYDFDEPTKVGAVEIYWFDDTGRGACRLPESWKLMANVEGEWSEVVNPSEYGIEPDGYNRTTFDPITAEGLRLEIQSAENFAGGLHEWKVEAAD
jgi:uncharacterized protein